MQLVMTIKARHCSDCGNSNDKTVPLECESPAIFLEVLAGRVAKYTATMCDYVRAVEEWDAQQPKGKQGLSQKHWREREPRLPSDIVVVSIGNYTLDARDFVDDSYNFVPPQIQFIEDWFVEGEKKLWEDPRTLLEQETSQ